MKKELIERIEVGSGGASSIEFTGIPQDGKDLILSISSRQAAASALKWYSLNFNNASVTESFLFLQGNGSAVNTYSYSEINYIYSQADSTTADTFSSASIYISNYASSTTKSLSVDNATENNGTTAYLQFGAASIALTSAISSIQIDPNSTFMEHTTASLYKVVTE